MLGLLSRACRVVAHHCADDYACAIYHGIAAMSTSASSDAPTRSVAWGGDDLIRHGTPAFRHTNLALFAAGFATFGLLYCVQPLMPQFSQHYGVSAAASALSLSLTTGVLAFAMLFAGGVSDAWGRKSVMVASLISSAVLVLITALMPNWYALLAIRTLLGLTLSGLPAVAMTYLSEEMHPESIGLGMGLYISGSAVGGMSGRLISGVVADYFGWRAGVGVVGVVGLISGLVFWQALPTSRHFRPQALQWRALFARFAGMFRHCLQLSRLSLVGAAVQPQSDGRRLDLRHLFGRYVQFGVDGAPRRQTRAPQSAVDGARTDAVRRRLHDDGIFVAYHLRHHRHHVWFLRRSFHSQ
jgi:hypothetical protein